MSKDLKPNLPKDHEEYQSATTNVNYIYEKLKEWAKMFDDPEEKEYYLDRARAQLKDYPALNRSNDIDNLHAYLVELITQRRLLIIANSSKLPLPQEYHDSMKRSSDLQESLATRRIDRKKHPEKAEDFQQLIQEIFSHNEEEKVQKDNELIFEEEKFLQEKKTRDVELGLTND